MPKKRGSDERDGALHVYETEDTLDPQNSDAEGNEGNSKNNKKRKKTSLIEVKEIVAEIQYDAAVP